MTGTQEYENKLMRKIDVLLDNKANELRSFYSFLGSNKTLTTKYNYIRIVDAFLTSTGKTLSELEMDDFANYINNIYQTKSSSYAITNYAALNWFAKYLVAKKVLSDDPMQYIKIPKYRETIEMQERREHGFLTESEIKTYMKNVYDGCGKGKSKACQEKYKNRDLLICSLFLTTGIRCSALMKIDVADIDYEKMELRVYDKGNKLNTYVLSDTLISLINNWLSDREVFLNGRNENALFISNQLCRMNQASIARVVKKYAQTIEGKNITPHKLRATYGTQVYEVTKDLVYTQQCMKHNSPRTTQLYIRGDIKSTKKASDIMSSFII